MMEKEDTKKNIRLCLVLDDLPLCHSYNVSNLYIEEKNIRTLMHQTRLALEHLKIKHVQISICVSV